MPPSNMSVFQRGGNYLHRRLTKLYSDTKQSYESATVASKTGADEDPILKALHREFRTQKDRLLAWGLQWTDSNAAPTPDVEIDQKLDQAGLGHVVALVMSDIQKLLIESEMIQNPRTRMQEKSPGGLDSKGTPGDSDFSPDDIAKSQSLLSQLITCIDSLYKLSESRRTMSSSSKADQPSKESMAKDDEAIADTTRFESQNNTLSPGLSGVKDPVSLRVRRDDLFIDHSWVTFALDSGHESEKPPSYEEVVSLDKTILSGMLVTARIPDKHLASSELPRDDFVPIIIQYVPSTPVGGYDQVELHQTSLQYARSIADGQSLLLKVAYTGSLRLLGYTIDTANARHGFVYMLPDADNALIYNHNFPIITNLRTLIPSKRDDSDPPSPNLEDRFRLAFNILRSMMCLSMQGLPYGDINSTNVTILSEIHDKTTRTRKLGDSLLNIRYPFLLHSPPTVDARTKREDPLSASIYRHADDAVGRMKGQRWAYDLYSYGLVLLEIGLWTPISRLWKSKYTIPTFTSRIKNIYVQKLASRCGTAYMNVVKSCIDAPDLAEARFQSGTMTMEENEIYWYSMFTRIGRELSRCCTIDIDGPPCELDLDLFERWNNDEYRFGTPTEVEKQTTHLKPLQVTHSFPNDAPAKTVESVVPDPKGSFPSRQTILRKWNNIDIPQECLDQWNNYLMPRISKLLQKALDSSRESCSASLMMVGKTPETAKTTICIQCTSVEQVRDCLRRNFKCKNGWGLIVLKGDIRRSGKPRRRRRSGNDARSIAQAPRPQKSAYQQKPQFGASIGAFRDNEHLPPVSFGGAILVDGNPYGMTVHHMLDAPSDDDEEDHDSDEEVVERSAASRSDAFLPDLGGDPQTPFSQEPTSDIPDGLDISDDESDCSTIRPDYIDLESGHGGFWFAGDKDRVPELEDDYDSDEDSPGSSDIDEDEDDDDRVSVGDVTGIDPADDEEVYVTQPAIDDVEDDFFPNMEDKDDDHLASHSLGYVHASSGIRRVVTGNLKHEVDWALIKIHDERLSVSNAIHQHLAKARKSRKGKSKAPPSSTNQLGTTQLTTIAPASTLPNTPIACRGRTSGPQTGIISPALALLKLHGRTSFSSSFIIEGASFGYPGDSGAWIYNPQSGALCGHVLAYGEKSGTAYMAPMEVMFEDMERRLGADRVELPGASSASLDVKASRQLQRQEVDLLQEGMRNLQIPPGLSTSASTVADKSIDDDIEMEMDNCVPIPKAKPLELALNDLQINEIASGRKGSAAATPEVMSSLKGKNKDIPNFMCQAQGQNSLEKGLGTGRSMVGSPVA
jgi:hypothetical protein